MGWGDLDLRYALRLYAGIYIRKMHILCILKTGLLIPRTSLQIHDLRVSKFSRGFPQQVPERFGGCSGYGGQMTKWKRKSLKNWLLQAEGILGVLKP